MDATCVVPGDKAWTELANDAHRRSIEALNAAFEAAAERLGASDRFDGSAVMQGAVAALLEFAFDGTAMTDAEVRADLIETIDALTPQVRLHVMSAGLKAGHA